MTSVTIPNSVTTIESSAFYGCSGLTSVTLPNSVTTIESSAFYGCSGLTSVTIGNSVTTIGDYAFYDCSDLTSITCKANTPPALGSNVFSGVSDTIPVYVPCGTIPAYEMEWSYFSNFQDIISIESPQGFSVTQIDNNSLSIHWNGIQASSYEIYRNSILLDTASETGAESYTYEDSTVVDGQEYCYQIKAIDEECESELSEEVCETFKIVGVEQLVVTSYKLQVYPNPTSGQLHITMGHAPLLEDSVIEIYNVMGQKLLSAPFNSPKGGKLPSPSERAGGEVIIDVSHLAKGMYFLKVGNQVLRFVKE